MIDNREPADKDKTINSGSNVEKDVLKTRFIDSNKTKIRHKDRISGGQNKQGHSSVYE